MNAATIPTLPVDGLSHVVGRTDLPLSDATIHRLLTDTVGRHPDRLAVVFREQGVRWTWREFLAEVDAFGAGLAALGLAKGDRVGIWSPNRVEWLVTQFATARMGLVLVNVNPAYRLSELTYALQVSGCRAIVSAERLKTSMYLEMLQKVRPELPALEHVIRMGDERTPGMLNYAEVLERGRAAPLPSVDCGCHEAINIQFTSGTTGNPKGATLTHHNVVNNGRFIAMAMGFSDKDSLCIPVPLYHCFGMVLAVLACVSTGAAMVFPGESFDPAAALAAVAEERCTALHGVPTMFIAELAHPRFEEFDLSSLRTGIMAGSPCPIETMKQVVSRMNMREVTIAYGMTETSPVSFQSSTADPLDRRTTTVGRVQPHLECKIIDADGNIVPVGEKGELCTRGYSVMLGYWNMPEETAAALRGGWMHTGDAGYLDDRGYLFIVDRLKDMIITGGENVYSAEVENALAKHPAVAAFAVIGIPDARWGERVHAVVIRQPGQHATDQELREFCRGHLAGYKLPRSVAFADALPMSGAGKILKRELRSTYWDATDRNVS